MSATYFFVVAIYFIIKMIISKNSKRKNICINGIIAISVICIILGIDKMTINIGKPLYDLLGVSITANTSRMESIFGYPNMFAINTYISYFLLLGKILSEKEKKYKIIDIILIVMHIIVIFLSGSRITIAMLTVFTIIYVYVQFKDKCKNIPIKKVLQFLGIGLMVCIVIIIFILNMKSDLVLFSNKGEEDTYSKKEIPVQADTDYVLKMEIETQGSSDTTKRDYGITIKQLDKNNNFISNTSNRVGTYNGVFEISFKTDVNTKYINIIFSCSEITDYTKFVVKKLTLNDKELTVNYRFIPVEIVDRIVYTNIRSNSVIERFTIITDGIDIIKKYPMTILTGMGGNTWEYKFEEVIDYEYDVPQMHNFILQLVLESGIITAIIYILIIAFTIKNMLKLEKNPVNLGIIFAVLGVFLHSLVDYELDNIIILIEFFILMSLLHEKKEANKYNVYMVYITAIVSIILSGIMCGNMLKTRNAVIKSYKELGNQKNIQILENTIKNERYFQYDIYTTYVYNLISLHDETYKTKIEEYTKIIKNNLSEDKYISDFEQAIEILENREE